MDHFTKCQMPLMGIVHATKYRSNTCMSSFHGTIGFKMFLTLNFTTSYIFLFLSFKSWYLNINETTKIKNIYLNIFSCWKIANQTQIETTTWINLLYWLYHVVSHRKISKMTYKKYLTNWGYFMILETIFPLVM